MNLSPSDISALTLSLLVAGVALAAYLVPCVAIGIWLGSGRSPWRSVAQAFLMIPLVMPPVVTGLLILKVLLQVGRPLVFTWWAAALASGLVAAPLLIRTVSAAVAAMDFRLVTVARTLGASRLRAIRTVTLPIVWHSIVGGAVLFWARAMGEFGAVMVVAGNTPGRTQTIPLAIYSKLESTRGESIWPLVGVSIAISLVAVVSSEWMVKRSAARVADDAVSPPGMMVNTSSNTPASSSN